MGGSESFSGSEMNQPSPRSPCSSAEMGDAAAEKSELLLEFGTSWHEALGHRSEDPGASVSDLGITPMILQ